MHRALGESLRRYVRAAEATERRVRQATIEINSFPIVVHGQQDGAAYNGHFGSTSYHPLVGGQLLREAPLRQRGPRGAAAGQRLLARAALRRGQVHSALGFRRFVENALREAQSVTWTFDLRLDVGCTSGEILDNLVDENVQFHGRLKKNPVLVRLAEPLLNWPAGRPPQEGCHKVVELGPLLAFNLLSFVFVRLEIEYSLG